MMNSTWYPEIEEPIKSPEKHYSLVLYMVIWNKLNRRYVVGKSSTDHIQTTRSTLPTTYRPL